MPDNGFQIKCVKNGNTDVTSSVVNSQYTLSNVSNDTSLEVEFEAIPPTVYTMSVKAIGSGAASYNGTAIRNATKDFSIVEGTPALISFTPDEGNRIKSVRLNGQNVTANVTNGQYTIEQVVANTSLEVEFEAIPVYTLSIKATGNGTATYNGTYDATETRQQTSSFSIVAGSSAVVKFVPDDGYRIKSVKLDDKDVTSGVYNNQYTISNIVANAMLEVKFVEDITGLTKDGVNYVVASYEEKTVLLTTGDYGQLLTVPATFNEKGETWRVTGVNEAVNNSGLDCAAVIWNADALFAGRLNNPNALLYVKSAENASADIQNAIVDGTAAQIVLTDAASGNSFYCPKAFTAKSIVYEHHYSMKSGYHTCQGWETLVLPYDATRIVRQSETELVPYEAWTMGSSQRPFWLYSLTEIGWKAETSIAANTPYIISMPNNENYEANYNISGSIQFIGTNVQVKVSDNLPSGKSGNKRLVPNYQNREAADGTYALNVINLWSNATGGEVEGSTFIRGLRPIHPFEAYMTVEGSNAPQCVPLFDGEEATGIQGIYSLPNRNMKQDAVPVYNLAGQRLTAPHKGLNIVGGKKVVVK